MLLQLDVERLVVSNVHEVYRGPALLNHAQRVGVLGVVEASQLAVIDTEAVTPQVEDALLDLTTRRGLVSATSGTSGRRASGGGIGDRSALDAFASKGLARAAEGGWS